MTLVVKQQICIYLDVIGQLAVRYGEKLLQSHTWKSCAQDDMLHVGFILIHSELQVFAKVQIGAHFF